MSRTTDFEKQTYWHTRFTQEHSFDWLTPSPTFLATLTPYLVPSKRILHLGSGTSDLHIHLRRRGHLVTNIDYEPLALERGRQLETAAFGDVQTGYVVADATALPQGEKYDLVLDKSTADAVSCGGDEAVLAMARSVRGVLAEGGVWISMSYSAGRFALAGIPFEVEVLERMVQPKRKETEPDVFFWVYKLRPV